MDSYTILMSTSIALFFIGLYGLATNKQGIKLIISLEIILASINLCLIAVGYTIINNKIDPQSESLAILSLSAGSAIIAFIIAMLNTLRSRFGTTTLLE